MKTIAITLIALLLFTFQDFELNAQCERGTDTTKIDLPTGGVFLNNRGVLGTSVDFGNLIVNSNIQDYLCGIWLSGRNADGFFPTNTGEYDAVSDAGGASFWPGPFTSDGDFGDAATCEKWDLIFEVKGTEIDIFLDDFMDNGTINREIPRNILAWPATGNPNFFEQHGFDLPLTRLAPFVDQNNDGLYNPVEGDYPNIKGAIGAKWWILNTNGNFNTANGSDNLNVDFHVLASNFSSEDEVINNSIVYDITMQNRNEERLDSLFFSFWMDNERACRIDHLGCMPEENFSFMYEAGEFINEFCVNDNFQASIIGVKQLNSLSAPRVINADNSLAYPLFNQEADSIIAQNMSSFKHYFNSSSTSLPNQTDPRNVIESYHLMQGLWRDGQEQLINGVPSRFSFPGNPASPQEGDFPMCNLGVEDQDIRSLTSCGPFRLNPNERQTISYAMTRIPTDDVDCVDISVLTEGFNKLSELIESNSVMTSASNLQKVKVDVYPNPVSNQLFIASNDEIYKYQILNLQGQQMLQGEYNNFVDVAALPAGIYFLQLQDGSNIYEATKFVKN